LRYLLRSLYPCAGRCQLRLSPRSPEASGDRLLAHFLHCTPDSLRFLSALSERECFHQINQCSRPPEAGLTSQTIPSASYQIFLASSGYGR
jgi:hypothetical protein